MSDAIDGETRIDGSTVDKVQEYFNIKKTIRSLSADLREYKEQHSNNKELTDLLKKVKELREEIKEDEVIKEISEKLEQQRERLSLIKEMVRIEMLENQQEEIEAQNTDRKLVIKQKIEDVKSEEKKKKFEPHKDQTSFN